MSATDSKCSDLINIINEISGFSLIARDDTLSKNFDGARDAAFEVGFLVDKLQDSISDCKSIATYGPEGPSFDDLAKLLGIQRDRS